MTYIIFIIFTIIIIYKLNLYDKKYYNFSDIYHNCIKIIKNKCYKNNIIFNIYNYGYEYYNRLLNASDCELCQTIIYNSHVVKCKNKNTKTHRSYIPYKYKCNYESNELYGTDVIQKWIYKKQHPQNCKSVKFLIIPYFKSGFGSIIHVIGTYLSLALNSNRIAIISHTAVAKYFIPLSNCFIESDYNHINISNNVYSNDKYVMPKNTYRFSIPIFVLQFLNNSPISHLYYLHYWRNQAAKYIYHLRENIKKIVNQNIKRYIKYNKNKIKNYPCINVWIRHGNKYKEMKLIDTEKYFTAIDLFKRLYRKRFNIYLSTDDRYAINKIIRSKYNVYYLNYTRYNDNISNWKNNHIYNIISDIELSLKCIAFIGTRGSNINRLIDELISTSKFNSNFPYFEIGRISKTNISNTYVEIPEFWR